MAALPPRKDPWYPSVRRVGDGDPEPIWTRWHGIVTRQKVRDRKRRYWKDNFEGCAGGRSPNP